MIFLLLALMVLIGLIFFFINKKDLCHPATLFSATYIVSVSCACLNIDKWDVDMIPATFIILLLDDPTALLLQRLENDVQILADLGRFLQGLPRVHVQFFRDIG